MATPKTPRSISRDTALDRRRHAENELQFAVILGQYHVRHARMLYTLYDGDLLLPMILGEIAFRNVSGVIGEHESYAQGIEEELDALHSPGSLKPCNASSIALSTGIPRETVRRKLAILERDGHIRREDDGFVLTNKPRTKTLPEVGYKDFIDFMHTHERIAKILLRS
ncbi:hypothetical protein SAMN05660652_02679 [Propionivibrio dicarboxylicus]|uniref:HTH iclR-type domain-containing protein n=2 Tax=Propionivibrio dicarboxylicus TaxID=83767 RepID=A0A1G8GZ02_9RHOO|nr:hypothetical protein SAMN05660652_02679 [Propionivibrio dicarboxylicus]